MNCESIELMLNAALDGELSQAEQAEMEGHLSECSTCRELWIELRGLDCDLKRNLSTPVVDLAIEEVMTSVTEVSLPSKHRSEIQDVSSLQEGGVLMPTRRRFGSRRESRSILVLTVCTLLMAAVVITHWPASPPAVAEIALTTGSVDVKHPDSAEWIQVKGMSRLRLTAHSRVRTLPKSLCEIHTSSDAIVRLNQQTELVVHRPEQVELVSGEFWCRAPSSKGLEVCSGAPPAAPDRCVFSCPSSTEMQWKAMPNQEMTCQDVSAQPIDIKVRQSTCTLQPGECVTFLSGSQSAITRENPVMATNWQLPLLALRNPLDADVQQRLNDLLAIAGEAKAAYFYDQMIRDMGPEGTIPLLAFVRSSKSLRDLPARHRAMTLAAEQAPESTVADLEHLSKDSDPQIRQLAEQALLRLRPLDYK